MGIDPVQAEIARIALIAAGEQGFALAGANALMAQGLLQRPTTDVDLFTDHEGGPAIAAVRVQHALEEAGYVVTVTRSPEETGGEFARLIVTRGDRAVGVDLARDWRARAPVILELGPVLHLDDAVSSKLSAMLTRGAARDFIDVAAATQRYSRDELLLLLFTRDPGLRVVDVAMAVRRLDHLAEDDFNDYGLDAEGVARVRAAFHGWPRDPTDDSEAERVHATLSAEETAGTPARGSRTAANVAGIAHAQGPTRSPPDSEPPSPAHRSGPEPPGKRLGR